MMLLVHPDCLRIGNCRAALGMRLTGDDDLESVLDSEKGVGEGDGAEVSENIVGEGDGCGRPLQYLPLSADCTQYFRLKPFPLC